MGAGYVGLVSIDLHLPQSGSLKDKRHELRSLKSDLIRRFGAAVAEVDHHDLRQRARLEAAIVDRHAHELELRLDGIERFVVARHEAVTFDHRLVFKPEDLT
jgi:uncharacterized protein YlxP (DUF503 family)